jgi:hypothetical protein
MLIRSSQTQAFAYTKGARIGHGAKTFPIRKPVSYWLHCQFEDTEPGHDNST